MLQKLLSGRSKAKPTKSKLAQVDSNQPDISRVIKIAPPAAPQDAPTPQNSPEAITERAAAAVESLSSQFDQWMQTDLNKLRSSWADALAQDTPENYRALFTAAHNIRGVAGSYGYPAISRLCGSLCSLLGSSKPGDNSALINLHIEACRAAHTSVGRDGATQSIANAVCDALESRVALKAV